MKERKEIMDVYNEFADRRGINVQDMQAISLRLILEVQLDIRELLLKH